MIFPEIRVILGAKDDGLMIVGDDLSPTSVIIDVADFNFILF